MNSTPLHRRRVLQLVAAPAVLGLPFVARAAEAYPSHTIRMVIPFTPGGGTDVVGRALVDGMQRDLGASIFVDNRSGGGTVIGSDIVAKAPPDGYTLLLTTSALAINDSLVKKLPYNTNKDFTEVGLICRGPNVLVTRPDSPYKTIADVIRTAKASPGKLSYGSSGNGSAVHLAGELFKNMAKVEILHVPYRGAAPAYTDLMGGQVDFVFGTAGGVSKLVESGRMRAIAVTSTERSPSYNGVPTIGETVPGYAAEVWYAVFAPAGTPPDVIARLNGALRKAAESPSYRDRLAGEGLTVAVDTPAAMTLFMRAEQARWRKVVADANIAIE